MKKHWQNWAQNQTCFPDHFHQPRTKLEIIELVNQARREGQRVRVVGSGHSWSPLVSTDDHLINLDKYNRVLNVNQQELTVTVQAGIRLRSQV